MTVENLSSIRIKFDGGTSDELSNAIKHHIEIHQDITFIDIVKFLYQSVLGSFHLLDHMDEKEIEAWIKKNLATAKPEEKLLTEKLYGDTWVRLNLGAFKHQYGNDSKLLAKLFVNGKEEKRVPLTEFATQLETLVNMVMDQKIKPINSVNLPDLVVDFVKNYREKGFPPLHHSPVYSEKSSPYIVVSLKTLKEFFKN